MGLNKLFDVVEQARDTANWRAAFGEPQEAGDKTIIPVAQVTYGFGLGFGHGTGAPETEALQDEAPGEVSPEDEAGGEAGGAGGGASAKPLGVLVVTPERVYVEETPDATKIATAAFLMGAFFIWQLAKTLRAIFGRE